MKRNRKFLNVLLIVTMLLSGATSALAQGGGTLRPAPATLDGLRLDEPVMGDATAGVLNPALVGASGPQQVVVRLSGEPAAVAAAARQSADVQRSAATSASAQQDSFLSAVNGIASATVLARLTRALNAVVIEVEGAALPALAAQPGVVSINPVRNYELDLSETVPYIGATPAVQAAGFRGKDVKVAVLDSGIDYTHAAFGGGGTLTAYQAAYGTSTADARNKTLDGLFPTARVVGGFDFVGEAWPNGPLAPDPDPIDCGAEGLTPPATCAGGHGTHVADIIGGAKGVAPEVDLYAVKVCSAVSTSCSGVAILQGLEFATDPNGDGDLSDHVDIVNMSLGSPYGQSYEEDSAAAVDNMTPLGILTVASAGNSADKPYIVGTPSAGYTALSVAQTTVPSDKVFTVVVNSPPSGFGTPTIGMIAQPWAPALTSLITAPLRYDPTNTGTRQGCSDAAGTNPWTGTPLAGQVALIDRGTCAVSFKVSNAFAAGAVAAIIANNTSGNVPPSFSFGGGTPNIPAFTITQADGLRLRTVSGVGTVTLDPAAAVNIVGSVVGTSSRGPNLGQMFYGNNIQFGQLIKPEIGAPGASISAVAGAGTGTEPFGGTSGAAPMVSGAAALLVNATNWQLSAFELKARLMNTAETNILNSAAIFGGGLAPITRIGGGEVRINRAIGAQAAAWEFNNRTGGLSFGFVDAFRPVTTVRRTVVVRNYGDHAITYDITPTFRFANDAANGAISPSAPASIRVPARSQRTFRVSLVIDASKLRAWGLNSGALGASGDALTTFEYDGYLLLTDASNPQNNLSLPWHVLPRLSGDVRADRTTVNTDASGTAKVHLTNRGAGPAYVDSFSLLGVSENQAAAGRGENLPDLDLKSVGVATFAGGGTCGPYILQFAVSQWERQGHAVTPGQMWVNLDTNRDGVDDFAVLNADASLNNITDGRAFSWVVNLRTGSANALFFAGHAMNSSNIVLTLCASQLVDAARPGGALPAPALGQLVDAHVEAVDNYFTGLVLDEIHDLVFAPAGERYLALGNDVAGGAAETWTITDFGTTGTNPSELGVLLLLDGVRGASSSGAKDGYESIAIMVNP